MNLVYNYTTGGISFPEISILKEKKINKTIRKKKKLIDIIEFTYGSGKIFLRKNYLTQDEKRCHNYLYFFYLFKNI